MGTYHSFSPSLFAAAGSSTEAVPRRASGGAPCLLLLRPRIVSDLQITPALVINKVDRLISELKLTPLEAFERLKRIIYEARNAPPHPYLCPAPFAPAFGISTTL